MTINRVTGKFNLHRDNGPSQFSVDCLDAAVGYVMSELLRLYRTGWPMEKPSAIASSITK